jgi:hypothetical protein
MYYYDTQGNYLLLLLPFSHCKLFTMLIKEKLTVQVTAKGLCFSISYPAPCVGGLAISCPLPPPSLAHGPRVTERGTEPLLVNSRLICSGKGFPRLWSITILQCGCHTWRITLHHKGNPPASALEPECSVLGRQEGWVGVGMTQERGGIDSGGR